MINILEINDLSNTKIVDLLKFSFEEINDDKIIKNYHPDFHNEPGNIFYILDQGRYRKGFGKYFVVTIDNKYACSAGWNEYELNNNVALLLTRMYVAPQYRRKYIIGNNILPQCIAEADNYKHLWITANDYNKSIYTYFERSSQNKRTTLFDDWPDIYRKFTPIGKKTVYYTEQWVAEYNKI